MRCIRYNLSCRHINHRWHWFWQLPESNAAHDALIVRWNATWFIRDSVLTDGNDWAPMEESPQRNSKRILHLLIFFLIRWSKCIDSRAMPTVDYRSLCTRISISLYLTQVSLLSLTADLIRTKGESDTVHVQFHYNSQRRMHTNHTRAAFYSYRITLSLAHSRSLRPSSFSLSLCLCLSGSSDTNVLPLAAPFGMAVWSQRCKRFCVPRKFVGVYIASVPTRCPSLLL